MRAWARWWAKAEERLRARARLAQWEGLMEGWGAVGVAVSARVRRLDGAARARLKAWVAAG